MKPQSFSFKNRCFIVAEISANHGQSLSRAIALIKQAKKAGADAVKFQTYTAETLTLPSSRRYFKIHHLKWGGQTLYQLYKKAYTPWKWFKTLRRAAEDEGIVFFSTPFDKTAVDFLESLNVPLYKVASFEIVDLPLIAYIAQTKKTVIISTGMASRMEIREAVDTAWKNGAQAVALLKCVSNYPAKPDAMNLRTIPHMARIFEVPVGLSDHSLGIGVSVAAVSLGARIIEKHLTLSRKLKTPDSFFSLEPEEFRLLVENVRVAEVALGKVSYGLTREEEASKMFRRSLFVSKSMKKGEKFSEENIRSVRPAFGLLPKFWPKIFGRKARTDLKEGTPLDWVHIQR